MPKTIFNFPDDHINNCVIAGELVAHPELRTLDDGRRTVYAKINTVRPHTTDSDAGAYGDEFPIYIIGADAEELCRVCVAGDLVKVSGRIRVRYVKKYVGSKEYNTVTELFVEKLLGYKLFPRTVKTKKEKKQRCRNSGI